MERMKANLMILDAEQASDMQAVRSVAQHLIAELQNMLSAMDRGREPWSLGSFPQELDRAITRVTLRGRALELLRKE